MTLCADRHLQDAVWLTAFDLYENDCGGKLWQAPKWVQEEYKNRARNGFGVTTLKEPSPVALEEKQRQVDFWGDKCCETEALLRELYAWHGVSSPMPPSLRKRILDVLVSRGQP